MKNLKKTIAVITSALTILCLTISIPMQAMAASMGDVIAKAREIGMPESEINSYIAQYGGRTYTSEQYQQAINALEGMRDKYSGNSSNETSASTEAATEATTEIVTETETTKYSAAIDDFFNKSSEEKIEAIIEMSDDDATGFWNALTDEQKESVKEVLNADDGDDLKASAEKAAEELGLTTEETTIEETTEEETASETASETATEDDNSKTEEVVENVKNTTDIMIWVVAGVIVAVVIIFLVIAAILKNKNSKKD